MDVDAGGKVYPEAGPYAMWQAPIFGRCKELCNDADVQSLPTKRRSEPIHVPLTSLAECTMGWPVLAKSSCREKGIHNPISIL